MKLTLVISTLALGGAQRALTRMANWWAEHGVSVTVLTFAEASARPFLPLHPGVQVRNLALVLGSGNPVQALRNNMRRVTLLRRAIHESAPDAVISFMDTTNALVLLATWGTRLPVLVAERTDPARHHIGKFWSFLRRMTYPHADAVVAQTEAAAMALPCGRDGTVHVLSNPVEGLGQEFAPPCRQLEVLSVGRFSPEKGIDNLLRAFALVHPKSPDWRLVLVGDGPCLAALRTQAQEAELKNCVDFPGAAADVGPFLQRASIFVLPSRYEGFPNALCEAMAAGLAVVATATTGALAVVSPGVDGLVVPIDDPEALSQSLLQLMGDKSLRHRLGGQARSISTRHSLEIVMDSWNRLLSHTLTRG